MSPLIGNFQERKSYRDRKSVVAWSWGWEQGLNANKYKRTFGQLKYFKLDVGRQFYKFTKIHWNIHLQKIHFTVCKFYLGKGVKKIQISSKLNKL